MTSKKATLWNNYDLPEETKFAVIELLNRQLADAIDLGLQAKQAHWNVKGPQFLSLHALFDETAGLIGGITDELAERAVSLGGMASGTLQIVSATSRLPVYPADVFSGPDHLKPLSGSLSQFSKSAREAIGAVSALGDAVSADLFTEIAITTDKILWKVESHLFQE
ncbi:MAG TPA: DNA starvation/stationary phase protection protein Dps [Chthoniobacterales bacterium]